VTAATVVLARHTLIGSARRSLAAEVRAVEEGHRAFVQPGGSIRVVSDIRLGVAYRVTFVAAPDGVVWFACTCPSGRHRDDTAPLVCKHQALAARRLEREGLARWDAGLWRETGLLDHGTLTLDLDEALR
jgi:hypothetical protein